ncbi:hypothetical protein AAC387_Pa05g0009 [Persea americana]
MKTFAFLVFSSNLVIAGCSHHQELTWHSLDLKKHNGSLVACQVRLDQVQQQEHIDQAASDDDEGASMASGNTVTVLPPASNDYHGGSTTDSHHGVDLQPWEQQHPKSPP